MKVPFVGEKKPKVPVDQMSLVDHLGELRTRLIRSVAAVVMGAIVVWFFFDPIFDFLSEPYCQLADPGTLNDAAAELEDATGEVAAGDCNFIVTKPLEPFSVQLSMSGYGGLILALPVVIYQLARFVMPGLYPREKRAVIPFVAVSVVLLALGITLGYLFLPRALEVLTTEFGSERFQTFFSPNEYLTFFIKMVLAFGLAFELPLVLVFLQMVGVLQTETLRKNRRIAVVLVVILGAVITPTGDPFTLLALSLPMYVFYELSMIIGGRITKRRAENL